MISHNRGRKVQITPDEISEAQTTVRPTRKQACLKRACDEIEELALLDFGELSLDSCIFIDRILIRPDGSFICKMVSHHSIAVPERKLNIAESELKSIKENLLAFISELPSTEAVGNSE